ncbi:NYN domain-containing protein [Egicoccus sp. AB-alg2]|uniref:NYN domain-containing protein n=1 Tax=Egicoccus sp. AB-alg2 TaxID=3242693 RepID=UPI00359D1C5C
MRILYIDAMNVIGSRPDGWWRDRDGAVRRLAARLQPFAAATDAEVVLVVDGGPVTGLPEGRNDQLEVRYARRRGRDAADDRIVELVTADDGNDIEVVTADRALRERVEALGAAVSGPRQLLDRLPSATGGAVTD